MAASAATNPSKFTFDGMEKAHPLQASTMGGSGVEDTVPATMSEALEYDDPELALRRLAEASALEAERQAQELLTDLLENFSLELPKVLSQYNPNDNEAGGDDDNDGNQHSSSSYSTNHPLRHATACADSIYGSLTKIAVGGSQASQEIRQLEQEKEAMEEEALCITTALALRQAETQTNAAWQNRDFAAAAKAIQPWLQWKLQNQKNANNDDGDDEALSKAQKEAQKQQQKRIMSYTGQYALEQLEVLYQQLQQVLLQKYEQAVQQGNLQLIGNYTPLLGKLQLEPKAVELYLQFLKQEVLSDNNKQATDDKRGGADNKDASFHVQMAKVYNVSVSTLRHHLPMVSHCLHKANGDVAVVQLVHEDCSDKVLPLWRSYQRERQFSSVRRHAERISDLYHQGNVDPDADAGFTTHIGSLSDVDSAMEEAAMCIQHAESYLRFMQHTCNEVNRARQMRHEQQAQQLKSVPSEQQQQQQQKLQPYKAMEILSPSTPLHEMVAEVGGQYVVIEHCLLLASMHRAYAAEANMEDAKYYRPLTLKSATGVASNKALQSVLVETCFYAARRSTQRAFCTGHTGTASAMANFCVEALSSGGFLEFLRHRAEDLGVAVLKPGDGLLAGGGGANYLLATTTAAMIARQGSSVVPGGKMATTPEEDFERRNQKVAQACAMLNDIQVSVHHTEQLMVMLNESIAKGFPANTHGTEQLLLCVKQFSSVQDQFRSAAEASVESLESILKPRIRAIVSEAVGSETSTFTMVSPVMGGSSKPSGSGGVGGVGGVGVAGGSRMNYNLDEEAYNFLQLSEGYMARLCSLLDELGRPLQQYLAPTLWDSLWISIVGTTAKRLEALLRKSNFTALGALAFDADMRDFVSFTREFLVMGESSSLASNAAVTKACVPLGRLSQMARLLNIDEVEDVLDVISSLKRKGTWDWKLEEAQAFLGLRFPEEKVKEVLRLQDKEM